VRKTKIIATLGPASSSDAAIRELIDAGVDVFRFNFSHGTHESHADTIARVRQARNAERPHDRVAPGSQRTERFGPAAARAYSGATGPRRIA
jgi:pyruvate kinase